ncbi:helix-turn-helix domain-containing protein [Chondromyces crocatus]|uniref:HTH araC/xylS-type domain-containing protein n=1 Tax=Chondromyces crocatus TaxID=52 RepID=A0A0K1EAS2_CHOCO|nr:helix-turn-helix transcriptional regulator [Chondromyces crocatus]AKT37986.1 uncharacterized protein CMC5_021270 [Chondromyces crocatus]
MASGSKRPEEGPITTHHDAPYGRFTECSWRPAGLAPWVEAFWYSEGLLTNLRERLLPNGSLELVLNLGAQIRMVEGVGAEDLSGGAFSGMLLRAAVLEQPPVHRVVAVRLRPAGAYALLGMPLVEVLGQFVRLEDLLGRVTSELLERCAVTRSPEACLRVLARWVSERLVRAAGFDPAIAFVASGIERSGGEAAIAGLAERAGLSKGRLATLFRDQVGTTPKRYARVVRFRRALDLLDAGAPSLAEVALGAGYYDQPHMNADFRELSGMSPRVLVTSRYPSGTSVLDPSGAEGG